MFTRFLSETSVSWNSVSSLLVKSVSGRHRRLNWAAASATASLCEGQVTPLWASSALKPFFSVCSRRDGNVITSKPHEIRSIQTLFYIFWIILPNVIEIDPDNILSSVSKLVRFLTQYINHGVYRKKKSPCRRASWVHCWIMESLGSVDHYWIRLLTIESDIGATTPCLC